MTLYYYLLHLRLWLFLWLWWLWFRNLMLYSRILWVNYLRIFSTQLTCSIKFLLHTLIPLLLHNTLWFHLEVQLLILLSDNWWIHYWYILSIIIVKLYVHCNYTSYGVKSGLLSSIAWKQEAMAIMQRVEILYWQNGGFSKWRRWLNYGCIDKIKWRRKRNKTLAYISIIRQNFTRGVRQVFICNITWDLIISKRYMITRN